jgi:hypothetical protein
VQEEKAKEILNELKRKVKKKEESEVKSKTKGSKREKEQELINMIKSKLLESEKKAKEIAEQRTEVTIDINNNPQAGSSKQTPHQNQRTDDKYETAIEISTERTPLLKK